MFRSQLTGSTAQLQVEALKPGRMFKQEKQFRYSVKNIDLQITLSEAAMMYVQIGINGFNGATSSRSLETWQDVQTGKAIPVLGKEHRFADHIIRSGNDVCSRDYFAALVGHHVSPEVRSAMATGTDIKGGF